MKILLIGSDYNWSLERIYLREFEALGHNVRLVAVQNMFYDYYYKSVLHKLIYRVGLSKIHTKINKILLNNVENEDYDLIWVFKGMEIFPETLKTLKTKTNKLINYNPDNPFIFSGKGSGNQNVTNSISLFDLHLTYDSWVKEKIEKEFEIRTEILTFGFDDTAVQNINLSSEDEVLAVCFLGNPDAYRAAIINSLLANGIEVHLYGNDWSKFIKHELAVIHKPVYGLEFYKTLRKYRVQLNIMRVHNLNSHNMRSMEIPGVGGVMLAPQTVDHSAFFNVDREIFVYHDELSLALAAKRILTMNKMSIDELRNEARKKVLDQFTYKIQTKRILSLVENGK
jgi:spore maturation protein CgeB